VWTRDTGGNLRKVRQCKYGCGKLIFWDDTVKEKMKFVEEGSRILHTYPRCADLLQRQGKSLDVFAKEKKEKQEDVVK
jgi:hypothetical protein